MCSRVGIRIPAPSGLPSSFKIGALFPAPSSSSSSLLECTRTGRKETTEREREKGEKREEEEEEEEGRTRVLREPESDREQRERREESGVDSVWSCPWRVWRPTASRGSPSACAPATPSSSTPLSPPLPRSSSMRQGRDTRSVPWAQEAPTSLVCHVWTGGKRGCLRCRDLEIESGGDLQKKGATIFDSIGQAEF